MIFNLGSINADNFYRVAHLPGAGETLAADQLTQGLGGKGANMSVAAVRAGARVQHIGAVGADGAWAIQRLRAYGVGVDHIAQTQGATGHANICIDPQGENAIVLFAGANHALTPDQIETALAAAGPGDWLMLQNETNAQVAAAQAARAKGLGVLYAAAPFCEQAVRAALPYLDLLVLNSVEAAQLEAALSQPIAQLVVPDIVITQGAQGCLWLPENRAERRFAAPRVTAIDTTGAGDTFTGFLAAGLDRGQGMTQAIETAIRAAALMVTRQGTADVIPALDELQ